MRRPTRASSSRSIIRSRARGPGSSAKPSRCSRAIFPGDTPVIFGRAIGRPDESLTVATLASAPGVAADMASLIIVGSRETRVIARPGLSPLVYTPRAAESVRA